MSDHSTYAGTQPAGEAGNAPGVPVGGMMAALWRARAWIVVPVILASAAAVLWLSSVTPLYRSSSKVLVENQETAYTRPSATTEERVLLDQESIKSQVQLILSGDLSRMVIRELDLASLPEFNPDGGPSLTSRILSVFGVTRDPSNMTNDERVLDRYYERLVVYQVDTSRVIAIEFSSEDPQLAARVANAIADGYIEMQKTAKRDATTEASDWLRRQVDSLREKVNDAERKVDEFRTANGLFSTLRGTAEPQSLSTQQLTELTTQLGLARAQKAEAQAKARLIREMLDSGRPLDSSEVLNSPLIQNLVSQQVTLRAQIAELSMTLGPRHPRMQELNAQLGDLRQQIREEATKYSRAAENDAAVAAEREQDLLASVDSLETGVAESNRAEVELRALERDAKSQRDLLELLLARYRDATAREDLEALPADARIISRAAPASSPYFPKTLATLLAAFLGSLILSCGIVITLELVRSANAYPGIGPLPTPIETDDGDVREAVPGEYRVIEARPRPGRSPEGLDSESLGPGLEDIRDEIVVRSAGEVGHTVLFTAVRRIGSMQGMAMRLARSIAAQGRRVVVVDTEFAEQSTAGESDDVAGLGDLLSGATDFEEAIQRDKASRVHIISAGQVDGDPLILLASSRMDTVLEALRHTYDVVILLAPAVIRHGEARLLAPRADQAVLLLTGSSGDSTARRAQDRLLDAGLVNVALLHVDGDVDGTRLTAA